LQRSLIRLVGEGRNVVVDLSMWRRACRDEYKALTEAAGGQWRLVYLRATAERLRRRLAVRSARQDANDAFPITDKLLDRYLRDFEESQGEGKEVIDAAALYC
jgi:predicted kinase